jgi:hypothetical protein
MMLSILYALGPFVADLFKSRGRLQAENLFLRHQLKIALSGGRLGLDCAVAGLAGLVDPNLP